MHKWFVNISHLWCYNPILGLLSNCGVIVQLWTYLLTVRTWGSPTTSQSCSCGSAKTTMNTIVLRANIFQICSRKYSILSWFFLFEDVRDDENHHFFNIFMSINSWALFDKLETMRFVTQNHGVSKNTGIYHGFGPCDDCADAVSQPLFLFMLGRCGVLSFPQRFLEAFPWRKQTWGTKSISCWHRPDFDTAESGVNRNVRCATPLRLGDPAKAAAFCKAGLPSAATCEPSLGLLDTCFTTSENDSASPEKPFVATLGGNGRTAYCLAFVSPPVERSLKTMCRPLWMVFRIPRASVVICGEIEVWTPANNSPSMSATVSNRWFQGLCVNMTKAILILPSNMKSRRNGGRKSRHVAIVHFFYRIDVFHQSGVQLLLQWLNFRVSTQQLQCPRGNVRCKAIIAPSGRSGFGNPGGLGTEVGKFLYVAHSGARPGWWRGWESEPPTMENRPRPRLWPKALPLRTSPPSVQEPWTTPPALRVTRPDFFSSFLPLIPNSQFLALISCIIDRILSLFKVSDTKAMTMRS